jgi:hypothetical protein
MVYIRPPCHHHWCLSICTTVASRLVSRHTWNQCQVSATRRIHITICCRLPARFFLRAPEKKKPLEPHTANCICDWLWCYDWEVLTTLPTCPAISTCLDPLSSRWLASDLQQIPTSRKLLLPGYRHLCYAGIWAFMALWDKRLEVNVSMKVWCVPSKLEKRSWYQCVCYNF